MTVAQDISAELAQRVAEAHAAGTKLRICAGGSKGFLGSRFDGERLDITGHGGIVDYEPNELVVTARAGTTLDEIDAALAQHDQILGFEPPRFSSKSTIGGTLACSQSGSARPWRGSVRDALLGVRLINGRGQSLSFGGRVIKNVAGFDVARLQAGAFGTLGVITQISIKVLPKPETTTTLVREADAQAAITQMNELAGTAAPISALAWHNGHQYVRLSGNESAVTAATRRITGEKTTDDVWQRLRDHPQALFGTTDDRPVWRFSVKPTSNVLLDAQPIIDWGGALRFVRAAATLDEMSAIAREAGGHVMRLSGNGNAEEFQQQPAPAVRALHERLKQVFDPVRILNPGRLYGWL